LTKRLNDTGTVLGTTLPQPAVPYAENFRIVLATILTVDQFATFFEIPPECVTEYRPEAAVETPVAPAVGQTQEAAVTPFRLKPPLSAGRSDRGRPSADEAHHDKKSGAATAAETNIRVSVAVLDRLMNLAGELVLSRNQLLQTLESGDRRRWRRWATVGSSGRRNCRNIMQTPDAAGRQCAEPVHPAWSAT